MNRIRGWLGALMSAGVGVLGGGCLLVLLVMKLTCTAYLELKERIFIEPAGYLWLLPFSLALLGIGLLLRWERKISQRWMFVILSAVYLAAGLVLIFSVTDVLRADPNIVYQAAKKVLNGDLSSFDPNGYMGIYPQQIGIFLYDLLWGQFTDSTRVFFVTNLFCTIGINWFVWQMADILFDRDHRVNLVTIALSFAFLPQFFFIMFAYGLLIGFFCLCAGIWMLLRFHRRGGRVWWALGGALLLVVAAFLKKNYLIGILAVAIWEFVLLVKERGRSRAGVLLALALLYVGFNRAVPAAVEYALGVELYDGAPSILWVAMGTDPTNDFMCHGWYNAYNWNTFAACGYDTQLAAETGMEKVRENLDWYLTHPEDFKHYFGVKAASTWCEPTFGSVWSGPLEWCGQSANTELTRSLYDQDQAFWLVYRWMEGLVMLLYVCALAGVILQRRRFEVFGIPCLYLLGGVIFHLFWETKSLYVHTYIFLLVPLCACALARGYGLLSRGRKRAREEAL